MSLFGKRREGGVMDEIRCDEVSYLIWKWSPNGQSGSSNRENAIRWGSSLRVKAASVAVFLNAVDEAKQDYIEGPYDGLVETGNLPVLAGLIGKLYDGGTPFQAEVYFVNLARTNQVLFGVPFFDVFDARFPDFGVPVAVRGSVTFGIEDYRRFVSLNGLRNLDVDELRERMRSTIAQQVKSAVTGVLASSGVPVVQIESLIENVSNAARQQVSDRLDSVYGVSVASLGIEAIEVDRSSEGYAKLMEVTRDVVADATRARSRAEIREMEDMQRIHADHLEETLRIQREEEQYAQRMRTREEHLDTYRISSQVEVAMAGAEALGRLGEGSAANIDGSGCMNPAGIVANVAMGGAVAQNLAGAMSSTFEAARNHSQMPPVPKTTYHVVIDGQSCGPFVISELARLVTTGRLSAQSYVWTDGMDDWVRASTVPEVSALLGSSESETIPPIPFNGK